jgi:hypothetical protein
MSKITKSEIKINMISRNMEVMVMMMGKKTYFRFIKDIKQKTEPGTGGSHL